MSKYRSAELIQKKRKDFWVKISLFFIAFVLTILCLSELSKFHFVNIKKINIDGNKIIETSAISDIALKHLDGSFLWFLFSKRNAFLYENDGIIKDILDTHSRIKNIDLNLKNFSVLSIKITEREPFAFWCEKEEGNSLVENCFVVDKDGFIFDKSRGEELFKYYSESNNKKIGLSVFDSEKFRDINSFINFIKGLNVFPYKFVSYNNGSYEIYFENGRKIIFGKDQTSAELINNFQSVLNMEGFDLTQIDYVDLRFGNKVFYK